MELFVVGVLSACVPRFFTNQETKEKVQYFESGIQTSDGFIVLTSKDLREFDRKKCLFRVLATPSAKQKKAYTLKVVSATLQENVDNAEDIVM